MHLLLSRFAQTSQVLDVSTCSHIHTIHTPFQWLSRLVADNARQDEQGRIETKFAVPRRRSSTRSIISIVKCRCNASYLFNFFYSISPTEYEAPWHRRRCMWHQHDSEFAAQSSYFFAPFSVGWMDQRRAAAAAVLRPCQVSTCTRRSRSLSSEEPTDQRKGCIQDSQAPLSLIRQANLASALGS